VSRRLRDHGLAIAFAAACVWATAYVSLFGFAWNDYESEALPAYTALTGGHLWRFLTLAPAYGGSLELRAPFALLPGLWHGGADAVYRAVSIPCLIAAAVLAIWLVAQMRALGQARLARATTLALCIFNPATLSALQYGHAEEVLGAVLCVAAVLTAQRGHATWAGVLLALAIVDKEWALLAVGPVLLALPAGRRRSLVVAGTVTALFYLPLLLPAIVNQSSLTGFGPVAAARGGSIFQPWQLWWFLGTHAHVVRDSAGLVKVGYRAPPTWLANVSHPLIIALSVPLTLLAARRRRADAMLLLVLLMALRCALDTWDFAYYALPFILALLAWESLGRRRPPVFALMASLSVWLLFSEAPGHISPDGMAAAFAALTLPTLFALAVALYRPRVGLPKGLARTARPHSSGSSAAPISTV